ncbi:MAG TPA: extensin family protein, partial [Polyangiaceae bacterium]|nr:extensin family protein [Polyangiaceae bacterium]
MPSLPTVEAPDEPNRVTAPRLSGWGVWNALRGDPYELDDVERHIEDATRKVVCQPETMVSYAGTSVRFHGAVAINPIFRERLQRFEQVVAETATEVYGRAPRRLRHYGAYSCRSSRNRNYRLSEHALGNAIDVVGFDFSAATKEQALDPSMPKQLRGPFEVRVARHWNAQAGTTAPVHARFLRLLLERLQERENVFRGVIGPGHPGHDDHFHFDMSPWRYVRP